MNGRRRVIYGLRAGVIGRLYAGLLDEFFSKLE
jgi:hypothetical protein